MPLKGNGCDVVRLVCGLEGRVRMRTELIIRFDYGSTVPWVSRLDDGTLRVIAGPQMLLLKTPAPLRGEDLTTVGEFTIEPGQRIPFVLLTRPLLAAARVAGSGECAHRNREIRNYWSATCEEAGRWSHAVKRSLITLKALTFAPTGGMVAAVTTSLPEKIGGTRNWDYRFCWVRDATLTLLALMGSGYSDEARAWRDWLVRAAAGSPASSRSCTASPASAGCGNGKFPGSMDMKVRIQCASAMLRMRRQLDVYGEMMDALYQARRVGLPMSETAWSVALALLDHLETCWRDLDSGIWEIRGPPRHFTHSKMMAWVAFDRAIKSVEEFAAPGRIDRWRELRAQIYDDVCRNGLIRSLAVSCSLTGARRSMRACC